ncbi:ATP-binding protein [Streptomyces sp. NPDC003015]
MRNGCPEWLGTRLPDALLVVSELVANAASHTAGVGDLVLHNGDDVTELEVQDKGGTSNWPHVAEANPLAETGRGMRLVDALSDSWHVRRVPEGGKAVTAVFRNASARVTHHD